MIDTHCHLLPAIDDGPRSLRDSVEMARALVAAGVRMAVCTPHFSRRFPTRVGDARLQKDRLDAELVRAELPLRTMLAAEIGSVAAAEAAPQDLRQRILGSGFLLVELEARAPAAIVEIVLERVRGIGLTPIFAHPERCRAVRDRPEVIEAARAEGALLQVVAPSLTGRWGEEAAAFAWRLLDAGEVDLLASDAHRAKQARRHLAEALELISTRLGGAARSRLTEAGPAALLGDSARWP